jgi:hypothetical protein
MDTVHWGSNVVLNDNSEYVFDWFPTLEPENPILYRYRDWVVDRDGVDYGEFDGTLPPTLRPRVTSLLEN